MDLILMSGLFVIVIISFIVVFNDFMNFRDKKNRFKNLENRYREAVKHYVRTKIRKPHSTTDNLPFSGFKFHGYFS